MNNNKKNQYLEMFLNIADELLQEQKIKSRRDFSTRYLNRCSNYLGSLVWQNKKPSISSSWALFVNLNRKKQLPHWQEQLSKTLYDSQLFFGYFFQSIIKNRCHILRIKGNCPCTFSA